MLFIFSLGAVDDVQFGYKSVPSTVAQRLINEDEITLADGVKRGVFIRSPSSNTQSIFIGDNPATTIGNTSSSGVFIGPTGGQLGELFLPTTRPWDLYVIAIDSSQHLKFCIC